MQMEAAAPPPDALVVWITARTASTSMYSERAERKTLCEAARCTKARERAKVDDVRWTRRCNNNSTIKYVSETVASVTGLESGVVPAVAPPVAHRTSVDGREESFRSPFVQLRHGRAVRRASIAVEYRDAEVERRSQIATSRDRTNDQVREVQ